MLEKIDRLTLVIIRGLPESGKSTRAKINYVAQGFKHYKTDMYFNTPEGYKFDHKLLKDAIKWCEFLVDKELSEGNNVVVTNVFVKKAEYQPYVDIAKKYNADVIIETITEPPTDNHKTSHDIPTETLERMRRNFEY